MRRYNAKQDQTTMNAKKILRFLEKNKEKISPLLILCHDFPDPDTLASAFTLHHIAQSYGIQSRIVYGGIIGRTENRQMVSELKIPAQKLRVGHFKQYANVALVDTQPGFKNNSFPMNKRATIVIDQHPADSKPIADLYILDTKCGATSVLLAKALLLMKREIPVNVATALAYGILSDTLNLYRAGRGDIVDTYLQILTYCDHKVLARIQNPTRSRKFFVTLARAIQNTVVKRRVAYSHLGWVESPDLVSQSADFLLTYNRMNWCLCTGRYKGKLYVSLRTASANAQAGELLRDIFDHRGEAGGHGTIGGGSFKVSKGSDEEIWSQAELSLIERFLKRLRVPRKGEPYYPFK